MDPSPESRYFSQVERGVDGTHYKGSAEHLRRYLAEFRFHYSTLAKSAALRMDRQLAYNDPAPGSGRRRLVTSNQFADRWQILRLAHWRQGQVLHVVGLRPGGRDRTKGAPLEHQGLGCLDEVNRQTLLPYSGRLVDCALREAECYDVTRVVPGSPDGSLEVVNDIASDVFRLLHLNGIAGEEPVAVNSHVPSSFC